MNNSSQRNQRGQTTLEYMMALAFTSMIAILVTEWLFDVLLLTVGRLAFRAAVFLTTIP